MLKNPLPLPPFPYPYIEFCVELPPDVYTDNPNKLLTEPPPPEPPSLPRPFCTLPPAPPPPPRAAITLALFSSEELYPFSPLPIIALPPLPTLIIYVSGDKVTFAKYT